MSKQSPNRNQRTKGFKVKQGFKIFILIAVGVWLLYQLKHSHDEKRAYEESSAKGFEKLKAGHETKRLGRKGFRPWIKKSYELIDETEDSKPERVKEQNGGSDDDVVGHDRDRFEEEEPEEVEDLIDEEDKEKEEENEDEDGDDMGKQNEDVKLLEDQGHYEAEKDTLATSEKHYEENGASRVAMRGTQSIGTQFELGGLRRRKEEEVDNLEKNGTEEQQKKIMEPTKVIFPTTDSSHKW